MSWSRWAKLSLLVLFCIICCSSTLIASSGANVSTKRKALIIGNSKYLGLPLQNSGNYADLMAQTLVQVGFSVTERQDLTASEMKEVLRVFSAQLSNSDAAFFFFSGYGFSYQDQTWLVPVDFNAKSSYDLEHQALSLATILKALFSAAPKIIILDASRDSSGFAPAGISGFAPGLASVNSGNQALVSYSTSPGGVAPENSTFVPILAEEILKPGRGILEVMEEVANRVRKASNSRQLPWFSTTLIGDFYLTKGEGQLPTVTPQPPSAPPSSQASARLTDDAGERLRAFWRPHGTIDLEHQKIIRDWMDAHGLQNEPSITSFIVSSNYEDLRRKAADDLKATATELGDYEPKNYELQSIGMAKTFCENLRSFMRWDAFPKDYKAFLEAFAVNGTAAGVIYFLFILGLYAIAPPKFAAWHEWIANRGIPFSENVSKILAPFLLDTPHCLNAVVRHYRRRARELFDKAPEVKTRPKWVPAPLLLGDELLQDYQSPPAKLAKKPYVAGLEEIKARLGKGDERWTISIEGPGGVGKSALAFEIARWASDNRANYRLAPFPMLPILLESLERSTDKAETVDAAAAAQLRSVMNAVKISDRLLQALLIRKRVLVVVDGVSEMAAWVGQGAIGPDSGAVNARALVVTSRLPTNLSESLIIRPQGLTLAFLDRVLDDLISATAGSGRFNDGEREELRRHVRSLIDDARDGVKERQVPMIFLKLMIERADQLLKEKKQLDELPRTLSELVTDYTEQLLRNDPNIHLAMQQARTTAQVCMGKERSPAARSENRYTSKEVSKEILDKFVTAGLMVRSGEKGDPFYKFALDPVAEQLDANRLVIDIREERADQTELDDLTQRWEELPEDFVRALRRTAARYRQEICASHSAISLKLWSQESDGFGVQDTPVSASANDRRFRAFLSHNGADKPLVEMLAVQLEIRGVSCWLDKWNLIPGDPWQPAIEEALSQCDTCVVFFGPHGFAPWQNEEMRLLLQRRYNSREHKLRVLPVILPGSQRAKESDVPGFLQGTTWVEFRHSIDNKEALHLLVSGIKGIPPGRWAGQNA